MYKLFLFCSGLVLFGCNPTKRENIRDSDIDSMMSKMRKHIEPDFYRYQFDPVFKYLDSMHSDVLSLNDKRAKSAWHSLKGSIYLLNGQMDSARFHALQAHQYAAQSKGENKYLIE